VIDILRAITAQHPVLFQSERGYLPRRLVLLHAGRGTIHKPIGPQQRQDNIPHTGEVIAMSLVLKNQSITVSNTGQIMNSEQIFHGSAYILQRIALLVYSYLVKGKLNFHFGCPPVV
jgi:hypothetical protein